MMSPLHHAFCGTHSLLMYCLYVCVSCLYACCVCSIELIIITSHTIDCIGKIVLGLLPSHVQETFWIRAQLGSNIEALLVCS